MILANVRSYPDSCANTPPFHLLIVDRLMIFIGQLRIHLCTCLFGGLLQWSCLMSYYLGPPFNVTGFGKEKNKQISRKDVETVSEVTVVAKQLGKYTIV